MSRDLIPDALPSESVTLAAVCSQGRVICVLHILSGYFSFFSVFLSISLRVFMWAEHIQVDSCRLTAPIVASPVLSPKRPVSRVPLQLGLQ